MTDLKPQSGFKGSVRGAYGSNVRFTLKLQETNRQTNWKKRSF